MKVPQTITQVEINGEVSEIEHDIDQEVAVSPFPEYPGYLVLNRHLSPEQVFDFSEAQRLRAETAEGEREPLSYWAFTQRRSFIDRVVLAGIKNDKDPKSFRSYAVLQWINEQTVDIWNRNNDPKFWHSALPPILGTAVRPESDA